MDDDATTDDPTTAPATPSPRDDGHNEEEDAVQSGGPSRRAEAAGGATRALPDETGRSPGGATTTNTTEKTPPSAGPGARPSVIVKVGMVGDAQVGKTTLMVKYVENRLDEDYIQTLGVNFMEKSITLRKTEITFSIWDLGGHHEFLSMLPLVVNDAAAILFMFDLTRKSTLTSIKEWYRQARGLNRTAHALLVGTKYDVYSTLPDDARNDIENQARKFSHAMKAPLVFTSAHHSINVQKMFKVILSRVFELKCTLDRITDPGQPLLVF